MVTNEITWSASFVNDSIIFVSIFLLLTLLLRLALLSARPMPLLFQRVPCLPAVIIVAHLVCIVPGHVPGCRLVDLGHTGFVDCALCVEYLAIGIQAGVAFVNDAACLGAPAAESCCDCSHVGLVLWARRPGWCPRSDLIGWLYLTRAGCYLSVLIQLIDIANPSPRA